MNHLYFGDCLDVLRDLKENYPQPFIDLIYIDPPFNSKPNYNVLFKSMDMKDANVHCLQPAAGGKTNSFTGRREQTNLSRVFFQSRLMNMGVAGKRKFRSNSMTKDAKAMKIS